MRAALALLRDNLGHRWREWRTRPRDEHVSARWLRVATRRPPEQININRDAAAGLKLAARRDRSS